MRRVRLNRWNRKRAENARAALDLGGYDDEPRADLRDVLTDLRHYARSVGESFPKALRASRGHFRAELGRGDDIEAAGRKAEDARALNVGGAFVPAYLSGRWHPVDGKFRAGFSVMAGINVEGERRSNGYETSAGCAEACVTLSHLPESEVTRDPIKAAEFGREMEKPRIDRARDVLSECLESPEAKPEDVRAAGVDLLAALNAADGATARAPVADDSGKAPDRYSCSPAVRELIAAVVDAAEVLGAATDAKVGPLFSAVLRLSRAVKP